MVKKKKKFKNKKKKDSQSGITVGISQNVSMDELPTGEGHEKPQVKTKKTRKRRRNEKFTMKNGNMSINDVVQKKPKKVSDKDDNTDVNTSDLKTMSSQVKKPFSVDMSKIGTYNALVEVKDIQQLLLFSLLGPANGSLPAWAQLNPMCVERVVVVLFKYVTPNLFRRNEECFPNLGSMFDVVFPYLNSGYLMFIKSPAHSLLCMEVSTKNDGTILKAEKPTGPLHGKDYILTEAQLVKNDFIVPGLSEDAEDFFTIPRSSKTQATSSSAMFALDCEMCMSAKGRELTRISVVNEAYDVVYDTLVKPENTITDYLTRYSGITEEDLRDVETTLTDVQEKLKEIIPPDAIIVGHSLEFDFSSLKFFHDKVVDTSVVYNDARGAGFKSSLKYLARKYLKTVIQNDSSGHCSIEDARTCMKLVQLKISNGPKFGIKDIKTEKNLLDFISENSTKKGVIVDRPSNVKQYSGSSDALPCTDDNEVVSNVIKVLPKYQFVWSQLHNMDTITTENKAVAGEKMKPLLQQMDTSISKIHESLPNGTLFVVILGSADTSVIKSLRERGERGKKIKKAEKEAKRGLCFMKLVDRPQ